jgi:regulator of replication initiation timing
MTVLPVPVLRVAPDTTETTPPQGDSPALQSAPEITLAEVVEDLAHKLQLCRLQTQEARLIAQDSLAQATALRTEVKHLRSQLADLESIIMRELIQDLPAEDQRKTKTTNEPPSRNRSKTV